MCIDVFVLTIPEHDHRRRWGSGTHACCMNITGEVLRVQRTEKRKITYRPAQMRSTETPEHDAEGPSL
jgi:hypothetical protein